MKLNRNHRRTTVTWFI